MKKGFTLIEFLVVVLIIGILAAVALPQYQVAVAKARMVQLVTLANSVAQAEERYFLEYGQYTTDWEYLDIEINGTVNNATLTNPAGWKLVLHDYVEGTWWESITATDTRLPIKQLLFSFTHAQSSHKGKRMCYTDTDNKLGNTLCKNVTGDTPHTNAPRGYNYYFFR